MSRPWVIIKVLYDTATKKISISFKEEMALISALVTFYVQNQEKNINKILSVEQLYDCSHVYGEKEEITAPFFLHNTFSAHRICFVFFDWPR